jgi:hypothetical protein
MTCGYANGHSQKNPNSQIAVKERQSTTSASLALGELSHTFHPLIHSLMRIYWLKKFHLFAALCASPQLFCILDQLREILKTTTKALDQFLVHCIPCRSQFVMNPQTLSARLNQASPSQVSQVPRSRRLRHVQSADNVAHTQLTSQQQTENP